MLIVVGGPGPIRDASPSLAVGGLENGAHAAPSDVYVAALNQ